MFSQAQIVHLTPPPALVTPLAKNVQHTPDHWFGKNLSHRPAPTPREIERKSVRVQRVEIETIRRPSLASQRQDISFEQYTPKCFEPHGARAMFETLESR